MSVDVFQRCEMGRRKESPVRVVRRLFEQTRVWLFAIRRGGGLPGVCERTFLLVEYVRLQVGDARECVLFDDLLRRLREGSLQLTRQGRRGLRQRPNRLEMH